MKKILILLLTVAFVLGTTSMALATDNEFFKKFAKGARVKGDILKVVVFENDATALSGVVDAVGNASETQVNSLTNTTASDDESAACDDSTKKVTNEGDVTVKTGRVDAFNEANNAEEEVITENAQTKAECSVCVTADITLGLIDGAGVYGLDDNGHCGDCDCCPAEVKGDIETVVVFNNTSFAASGDINAVGNASSTEINTANKAIACGDTVATNKSDITVKNSGTVNASTGEAVSTNVANNWVCIDIFRGALSEKKCKVLVDLFLDAFIVE